MFELNNLNLDVLAGGKKIQNTSFEPFNESICKFLFSFSQLIISSKKARKYSDLIALAFWCSKKNILNLKKRFSYNEFRIGRGLIFHISPSNVPTNFFYSLIFGLLSGNSNIVKVPSKQFHQVEIICNKINHLLKLKKFNYLNNLISIIKYRDENFDHISKNLSLNCDSRVIWGGDKTINKIREYKIKPHATDITFSDRYSISIINLEKLDKASNKELKKLVRYFYNDTYMVDQNACSSPHLVLWYGKKKVKNQAKFWNELKKKVDLSYDLPMNAVTEKYSKYCFDLTGDYYKNGKIYSQGLYVVQLRKLFTEIESLRGKWGYFYEFQINDLNKVSKYINKKFQTLSYYGFDKKFFLDFLKNNFIDGIDRIVPIGCSLNIDLFWDGYDIIKTLSKAKYIE